MLNIVIFGAPGSGKGTQSARIVEKYGINHISTGDVLRAEIKAGTELGKTAKGYIDQGQLLPDELIIDILASTLDGFKESKGVIFDVFSRTIAQAEALKKMLAERGQEVSIMLDLDVPEDELMTRLIKRGQESGRADDNEETIKKRLVVYHSQTSPLIDWYKNDGKYQHINGLGTMEGIFAEIAEAIDKVKQVRIRGLPFCVILNGVKNLNAQSECIQILRVAQNDILQIKTNNIELKNG